jgi:hypothetical protein
VVKQMMEGRAMTKCGDECAYVCQQPDGFGGCGKRANVGVAPCQTCAANHYCPEHNPAPRIQKRDKPKPADGVQGLANDQQEKP